MKIEYTYEAGRSWDSVGNDIFGLIAGGADFLAQMTAGVAGLTSVVGGAFPAVWYYAGGGMLMRADNGSFGGSALAWKMRATTGAAVDVVQAYAMAYNVGVGDWENAAPVLAVFAGQNAANGGLTSARGTVRMVVTERAAAISFPYAGNRALALLGEADGEYFGGGQYPCNFVMSSQAVVSGGGLDAVARVPYFQRVKNPAAAGDKTGLAACGLAFAVGISATNGWVYGINETLIYQGLPLEVFSSPKAAHLGYVRDVVLAPCKNVANDDYLVIGGEQYLVFRENQTAALAVALKV
jgi:hypothetical protein